MDPNQKPRSGFKGTIEYIRLLDLVQVSCLAQLTHTIQVDSEGVGGRIYLESGHVVHAESVGLAGEESFYEMLSWDGGHFETFAVSEGIARSINRTWEYLLIEAIRNQKIRVGSGGPNSGYSGFSRSFLGTINDIGLTDLVQLICMDDTDRVLDVSSESFAGKIYVRKGQVCHAETGDLKGEEAFYRLMSARSGCFVTSAESVEGDSTISMPWEYLLMETMRYLDEISGVVDEQKVKVRSESLLQKVRKKSMAGKVRLAMTADKETRDLLIRDSSRMVQIAVLSNPRITDGEVASIAYSRHVDEEVLRRIAGSREWIRFYPVRLALATNPKTPLSISMKLIAGLNRQDLKNIARSKSVPSVVANEARRRMPK